jgi:CheY-like chemotaxis protein
MSAVKIFLAEDDDEDSALFHEALSSLFPDFLLHRVKDGFECLYSLKHFCEPDIIFLDLNMPLKNGIDCLSAVRRMPELAEVPVVIYSSSFNIKDIDAAYKNGAAYYFVKATSLPDFVEMLKKLYQLLKQPKISPILKTEFVVRPMTHRITG